MPGKESKIEIEKNEWVASLKWVIDNESRERAVELVKLIVKQTALRDSLSQNDGFVTDYVNSIAPDQEESYPGDPEMEQKLLNAMRWNAMAMVVKANIKQDGLGGHISTYASAATLFEVGFNHFFRGYEKGQGR